MDAIKKLPLLFLVLKAPSDAIPRQIFSISFFFSLTSPRSTASASKTASHFTLWLLPLNVNLTRAV